MLTIQVGDNESSKYWLSVLNELKNRGVKDILVICADGLTDIKETIGVAFPKTEYQRCIVHQVRNTLKYVPNRDRKAFATDLKTIYQAPDEKKALVALEHVIEKWTPKYQNSSFYTVHHIQKYSKQKLFVYCVFENSSNLSLFLNFFTHSSPSSNRPPNYFFLSLGI